MVVRNSSRHLEVPPQLGDLEDDHEFDASSTRLPPWLLGKLTSSTMQLLESWMIKKMFYIYGIR